MKWIKTWWDIYQEHIYHIHTQLLSNVRKAHHEVISIASYVLSYPFAISPFSFIHHTFINHCILSWPQLSHSHPDIILYIILLPCCQCSVNFSIHSFHFFSRALLSEDHSYPVLNTHTFKDNWGQQLFRQLLALVSPIHHCSVVLSNYCP